MWDSPNNVNIICNLKNSYKRRCDCGRKFARNYRKALQKKKSQKTR